MTKKDYELIAKVLQNGRIQPTMGDQAYKYLVKEFAKWLWLENNRFDFTKFFQACNLQAPEELTFE